MKKLDQYILRKFLGTFVYSISLISIVIIIFDLSEKMDDFIDKHAPIKSIVFNYYFNFVPYIVNLFSPLFTFISVVFFTSRMAARSEVIAILSSGVSFRRFLYPYFAGAFLIAALSLYFNNVVIPNANKKRLAFENTYIHNPYMNFNQNIHRQVSKGVFIYMESYNTILNTGYKFSMEKIKGQALYFKLMSDYVVWDSVKRQWKIYGYFIRRFDDLGRQSLSSGNEKDTALNFLPSDFVERLNDVEAMNHNELNNYIEEQRMQGSTNILFYEVEKYKRTAFPFATFILTLIGVSLSSRKVKGGTGLHLGMGLLIAFSFILVMRVSTTFAEGGLLSPLVSVWIPNLLYGILAFFMIRMAPK
ncbi:MAG: YjgP/YjgQ family permease [Bacteroidia bacterium]|nr:YjgP/YjgQ family permease [Bacteroidia bacterium]